MLKQTILEDAAARPDFLAAPRLAFNHPSDVLGCGTLPIAERRAILAAWASDAHAVEGAPHLRQLENGARAAVSDILEALRRLDADALDPGSLPAPDPAARELPQPSRRRRAVTGMQKNSIIVLGAHPRIAQRQCGERKKA